MGLVDDIQQALTNVYGEENPQQGQALNPDLGEGDAEAAAETRGLDLTSILQVLQETNFAGKKETTGTNEYIQAFDGVKNAVVILQALKQFLISDKFSMDGAEQYLDALSASYVAVEKYLTEKERGIFFKQPITRKGKKRYACMKNAHKIMEAAFSYFEGLDNEKDDQAIDASKVTPSKEVGTNAYRKVQLGQLGDARNRGLDNQMLINEVKIVSRFLHDDLFEPGKLTEFLENYKARAYEIPVKAVLMRKGTPAANRCLVKAMGLGGSNLVAQLTFAYQLLEAVDKMADDFWKHIIGDDDGVKTEINADTMMKHKKYILKLIRILDLEKELNVKKLERL